VVRKGLPLLLACLHHMPSTIEAFHPQGLLYYWQLLVLLLGKLPPSHQTIPMVLPSYPV
jgi:hypothetical protein